MAVINTLRILGTDVLAAALALALALPLAFAFGAGATGGGATSLDEAGSEAASAAALFGRSAGRSGSPAFTFRV